MFGGVKQAEKATATSGSVHLWWVLCFFNNIFSFVTICVQIIPCNPMSSCYKLFQKVSLSCSQIQNEEVLIVSILALTLHMYLSPDIRRGRTKKFSLPIRWQEGKAVLWVILMELSAISQGANKMLLWNYSISRRKNDSWMAKRYFTSVWMNFLKLTVIQKWLILRDGFAWRRDLFLSSHINTSARWPGRNFFDNIASLS